MRLDARGGLVHEEKLGFAGRTSSSRPRMGTSLSELELSELSALRFFRWTGFFGGGFLFRAPPGIVCGSAGKRGRFSRLISILHMMLDYWENAGAAVQSMTMAWGLAPTCGPSPDRPMVSTGWGLHGNPSHPPAVCDERCITLFLFAVHGDMTITKQGEDTHRWTAEGGCQDGACTFPAGFFLAGAGDGASAASSAFFFFPSTPIDAFMAASSCRCSDLVSPDILIQTAKARTSRFNPSALPVDLLCFFERFTPTPLCLEKEPVRDWQFYPWKEVCTRKHF